MSGFWLWLLLWMTGWIAAIMMEWSHGDVSLSYLLTMAAIFFIIFFFTSLARKSYPFLWFLLVGILTVAFLLPFNYVVNPFVWLMVGFVLVTITHHTKGISLYCLISLSLIALFLLHMEFITVELAIFFLLLAISVFLGVYYYKKHVYLTKDLKSRNQALLHTYRRLKRDSITRDQHAREQERVLIGREIHDRVGHTLTNLLMQIEILRMEEKREDLQIIKKLAQESLSETRKAVRALKDEHITGIGAIIQLIRKLEAEHYISVQFSMKQNALSVMLSPEQASVVYRAIQESLTNAMRHGKGEEVVINLAAPGMTHFRFEVINRSEANKHVKEGFGLQSMRERLAQVSGTLEIRLYNQQFIVSGILPLRKEEEAP